MHAVGMCTHVPVAVSGHADALHLLRAHIQGCTAPQSGVTFPSGAWGKAELGGELPSRERGQRRDSRGLTGSGDDPISSSFSSWAEERWSCSSVFSACGRQRAGLGKEDGTAPRPLCPCTGAQQVPARPQTCTRGGRCRRGSTRPSSRTAARSPPRSQDTPPRTPRRPPRGGSRSHCHGRKSSVQLGLPIPCVSWGSHNADTGAGGCCHSSPRGPCSCPLMSPHSKVPGWRSAQGPPVAPVPAENPARLAQGH